MKGFILPLLAAFALLAGTYGLMIGAISLPVGQPQKIRFPTVSQEQQLVVPDQNPVQTPATEADNHLSREAMEQVIDCYAGKPVYLDPDNQRPLYPSCERLLRIYQGQTTEPEAVLKLLMASANKP
ncbi:hypothetical protein MNBD_ALPHA06-811 [hydrothermal vent metagenome]|uniref:Uncharacterized protein n=1 Tax=hydrothermal vent metagenome TaxID=652676 RepID=A0A3B0SC71_9ZZZZ